jgi:hypothetical protein
MCYIYIYMYILYQKRIVWMTIIYYFVFEYVCMYVVLYVWGGMISIHKIRYLILLINILI